MELRKSKSKLVCTKLCLQRSAVVFVVVLLIRLELHYCISIEKKGNIKVPEIYDTKQNLRKYLDESDDELLKRRNKSPKNTEITINSLFQQSYEVNTQNVYFPKKLFQPLFKFTACVLLSLITLDARFEEHASPFQKKPTIEIVFCQKVSAVELTEEQKLIARTWRLVDKLYLDRTFNGVDWFKIRQENIKKKYNSMDEAYSTISNFLLELGDPYTRFLIPSKYRSLVNSATGEVAGIGVELSTNTAFGFTEIVDVLPGSPAEVAGLKMGDLLVEVSAESTSAETADDTASRLRGPAGTKVGLVALRNGQKIELILNREKVKIQGVRTSLETASSGEIFGVVRIKSFSSNTAEDVSKALDSLKAKGAKNFVMDLRGNSGGLLPGGVDTARLFLKKDSPIVYVINKSGVVDAQFAIEDGSEVDVPLVVLVDERTASAAEVVAAALKENGRAKLVGRKTFGKGIIQTIEGLPGDAGVAVTIARYETPQRNNINKVGIEADFGSECRTSEPPLNCLPKSF